MSRPTMDDCLRAFRLGAESCERPIRHLNDPYLEAEMDAQGVDATDPLLWALYLAGFGIGPVGDAGDHALFVTTIHRALGVPVVQL